jgi:hypothetical protein
VLRQVYGGPNYTYLKLKMPRPNIVITDACGWEQFELAIVVANSAELKRLHETLVEGIPDCNEPTSSSASRSPEDTEAVEIDPNDPTKTMRVGT